MVLNESLNLPNLNTLINRNILRILSTRKSSLNTNGRKKGNIAIRSMMPKNDRANWLLRRPFKFAEYSLPKYSSENMTLDNASKILKSFP